VSAGPPLGGRLQQIWTLSALPEIVFLLILLVSVSQPYQGGKFSLKNMNLILVFLKTKVTRLVLS
jgi:hypothetical protein